jgi:uncharacterized delta-60 repeat protein
VTTDFGGGGEGDEAGGVAIDAQGRIVAVGNSGPHADASRSYDFALARYTPDGSLDRSFGTGGEVTTDFGSTGDGAGSVAFDSEGRIVAAGQSNGDFALARYSGTGSANPVPPTLTISGPSKVRTRHHRARAKFSFEADEPVTLECRVGHAGFKPCSSPFRTRRLRIGKHRLKVRATNLAAQSVTASRRFEIVERRS